MGLLFKGLCFSERKPSFVQGGTEYIQQTLCQRKGDPAGNLYLFKIITYKLLFFTFEDSGDCLFS
jgi:hypothetical protein